MKSPIQRQLEIFSAALERSAGPERDAFLTQACAGDDSVRQGVETLLAGHAQAGNFLAKPAGQVSQSTTHLLPITEKAGDRISRYKLLQQIGEGGCGTVYMAEQEEPVRRRVALKVIRLGMDTKTVVARFEAERQALALMDHPNIAKVFDGGATESGRPYFVMELVRGIKITEYCDQAHLSTEERLKLFIQVCQAVQHAHQKGVIHRDIKPSNILVTVNDGVPVPKVIDFGIAKATDQRLTDKTYFTEFQAFIGTPAYTSPEQAEMSSLDIDTRSDIYSLGVLLYEMLTGQTPFPAERLLQSGLDEMRRIIREEEPPTPSQQVERMRKLKVDGSAARDTSRGSTLHSQLKRLSTDLDWIVMKALEKDRTRRYATSLDFAADLQRHLDNEPVLAGAPSQLYKFQKLIRRNKGAVVAVAAVLVALLTGLGLTAWQAVRAKNAEQAARRSESAERAQFEQARTDRDRAVLAESKATDKATVATNALQTAKESMVKLNVVEGWRRLEEGDHFGALLPFAEAFALEQDKPDRAEIHQMRLASVLQHCPKLVNVWSVGTNISWAEFSRDGSRLLTASKLSETQAVVRIWDSATGRPLTGPMEHAGRVNFVQWSLDEKRIVSASDDKTARVWDAATGVAMTPPLRHEKTVLQARFNSDATRVLTTTFIQPEQDKGYWGVGGVSLWNTSDGKLAWKSNAYLIAIEDPVVFSPDGRRIVTPDQLLDADTGTVLDNLASRIPAAERPHVRARFGEGGDDFPNLNILDSSGLLSANRMQGDRAAMSSDGKRLFMAGIYDLGDRSVLCDGQHPERIITSWKAVDRPYAGRFSFDGKRLAMACDDWSVRVADSSSGSPPLLSLEHRAPVSDVRFSMDGLRLATASQGGLAHVWDASTGKPLTTPLPHGEEVLRVAFSADGNRLFVTGAGGTIAGWDLSMAGVARFTWPVPNPLDDGTTISCKGQILKATGYNYSQHRIQEHTWNLSRGETALPPLPDHNSILTKDGSHLVSTETGGWAVMDVTNGKRTSHSLPQEYKDTPSWKVERSDNGQWVLFCETKTNQVLLFHAISGEPAGRFQCDFPVSNVAISPDGKQLVGIQTNRVGVVWNLPSFQPAAYFRTNRFRNTVSYSPNSRWIVTGDSQFWDATTGLRIYELEKYWPEFETSIYPPVKQISPDDCWVVVPGLSPCKILSLTNGMLAEAQPKHRGPLTAASFTPDSKVLVTAGSDRMLRFWSVPIGEPIGLPLDLSSKPETLLVTPDGHGIVTVLEDKTIRFWELATGQRPVSDWLALARFFAKVRGKGVDGTGGSLAPSDSKSFRDEWLALRAKHPEVFTVSADEIDGWLRHQAWRCESEKNWSSAVAHLTRLLETHPDSGDFLPRRAAACVAWAESLSLIAARTNAAERTVHASSPSPAPDAMKRAEGRATVEQDQSLTSAATNLLERALADYARTLAWVDRFPAVAKESRKPVLEERRKVLFRLGRRAEAEADERELKSAGATGKGNP